jgi:20S proteasome subunit alpha 7
MPQAVAGLLPDARQLVSRAREEARGYRQNFGGVVPPRVLNDRLGSFVHLHTVYWYLRPTGAALLLGGYDPEARTHELYCVEPNGMAVRYYGYAIGKGQRAAKTEIEKAKFADKTCEEALGLVAKMCVPAGLRSRSRGGVHDGAPGRAGACGRHTHPLPAPCSLPPQPLPCALRSLHTVHDSVKDKPFELELSWVAEGTGWRHEQVPAAKVAAADAWAKAQIEAEEMGDDDDDDGDD